MKVKLTSKGYYTFGRRIHMHSILRRRVSAFVSAAALLIAPLGLLLSHTAYAAPFINEYPVPTSNAQPYDITVGPDGALWFTETANAVNQIGRMTIGGDVTEYPVP